MSLSNLQSQLAALNNSRNAGLALSSSKRHEDAVGRGLHYSVHHGQTIADKSVLFKATLLHAKARDAADVPVKVLRENCKDALIELGLEDSVPILCSDSGATPNQIRSILLTLTCLMADNSQACLQVLEFLLRNNELHVHYIPELIWTLLPYADNLWLYFGRCLQLVDLTTDQSYIWLRPYVGSNKKKIPLALMAQHVVKNTSWLTKLVQVIQSVTTEEHYLLSWSMTLLANGLSWMARHDSKVDKEAVIRTIFPCMLTSFSNAVRRDWSYVIVSIVAEHMDLAPETVSILTSKILAGAAGDLEAQADAVTAVLSVLMPPKRHLTVDEASYMPLINNESWLGCSLPKTTFREFVAMDSISVVLGYMYRDRRILVAPLLAAIVVMCIHDSQDDLLVRLAKETHLRALWADKSLNLAASTTAMVVKIYLGSLSLDKARAMLQALRVMDAAACNRGLVSATRAVDLVKENQQKLHNLMNGIVSLDIVAIKDSDEHVEVVPEPTSDNMQEDAMEVDSPSSDTEDMDMVEMILKEWSKDEDEELATAARRLLSDDKTLTETRLSVIFEAATRPDTDPSTIVKQVTYAVSMIEEAKCPWLGLLPAMMLLEHRDARVRDSAIFFLQTLGERLRGRSKWSQLSDICNRIGEVKVTAKMGGTFLSSFIATCLKQSQNASALLNLLLELCVHAAASTTSDTKNKSSNAFSRSWVTFSSAKGSCEVASFILDILEQAGEELCPLLVRWSGAGCVLLDGILKHGSPAIPCALLLSLVKMLKGIQAAEPQMIISSGPSGAGGRSRSYSVGKMDGVTIVDSYPEEMTNIVLLALKQSTKSGCHKMIARLVATEILTSTSWRDGVFVNFCPAVKQELASSLFCYAAESSHDEIEEVFMSLPFDAIDLCSMLTQKAMSHASISVTYVSGFVRLHAHQLMTSRQGIELLNTMFDALKASSSRESVEEETSFTQHSLMVAIGQLLVSAQDQGLKMDARSSKSGISVVLALLRGGTANKKESYHMLTKIRSRAAALQILEWYCNLSPTDVVPSLLDVAKASIDLSCGAHNSYTQHARDTLTVITPLIKKFGHVVGLRMESLFSVFISVSVDISEEQQFQLYRDFVHVLHDSDSAGGHYNDVNGLLCVYLSHRAHLSRNDADSSDAVRFITQVLSSTPMTAQVSILFSLLNYGNDIIADLINSAGRPWTLSDREGSVITKEDLEWIAINGAKSTEKDSSRVVKQLDQVVSLAKVLLDTFADCLLLNGVNRFFKKTGDAAELCLQIWQKMLEVHATSRGIYSGDAPGVQHFLVYAMESIDQSRRLIQSMLPVHVFLASVTLIIKEGGTPDVKASALHLVADRVATISHSSPEVLLFADLVEDITSVIGSNNDVNLACSALLALEHICRVVGRSISQKGGASSRHFIHGLTTVGNMLESSVNTKSLDSMTTEKQQLICSLALCAASLVKTIGTASLSSLATIVNSLVLMLHTDADMSEPAVGDVRVLQLSIVRSLGMIIESVPQFLAPYLQKILTEKAIFSKSLRVISLESSNSLKVAIDRFDMILAEAVPARILIPTLCKSVEGCVTSTGVCSVMAILEKALIKALSAEVSAQRNAVLKALTMSCDVTENFSEQECIIKVDERVLVAFVMKLSELQLRRAFTYLREWRGDGTARKFTFWTFSNVLSKKLKTIFLPCLSMAMTDAVGELRHASNAFTRRKTGSEKSGDHKRRRIQSDTEHGYDIDSMRCIQPLLLCLESSLRTDSQVGGNWLRSDEENRYHALLTPLGDLLESKLPDNFPVTSTSISAYQELIYGTDGITGSVVGCLTALASAAGNEQLWKPLNHAVLEACGNEHRAEVRRAGLECLISLMRSLGEEYMVLLPECLPVLSEALEDTNEDNAALAREIIALGEELLGENLMDNMR